MSSFCHIRKFKDEDQYAVNDIIMDATMEQVGNFFYGALFSEFLPQISVLLIAVCYILVGIPLKYCLFSIPFAIILLYIVIWTAHYVKANELCNDLKNIPSNYMEDPQTCFYVAEVHGKAGEVELASLMNKTKKVEYDFYNSKEFETKTLNLKGLTKIVVGCIAITRSLNHSKKAWIRRVAVKKAYRRRRIASHLLTQALAFCQGAKYEGVELIATECHSEAKQLYDNEGFKEINISHKSYFIYGLSQVVYHLYRSLDCNPQETEQDNVAFMENKV